jgi:hypothetical protein
MGGLTGLMGGISCSSKGRFQSARSLTLLLGVFLSTLSLRAVTLAWDRNSEPDLAGYKMYYGQTNSPAAVIDVGTNNMAVITNLSPGSTYFFYATAYNTAALESQPSERVLYTVPPSANTQPQLSSIEDVTIDEDSSALVSFTVTDLETPSDDLLVQFASSNLTLVSIQSFFLTGTGSQRNLEIRPTTNQFGSTRVTLWASDGSLSNSVSFNLTVKPVDDPPSISNFPDQNLLAGATVGPVAFTVSDVDTPATNITLFASSSYEMLIPTNNIVFSGSGTNRLLVLNPTPGQSGTAQLTVIATDGTSRVSDSFLLTISVPTPEPANVSITTLATGGLSLRIAATLGQTYTVEASTDLKTWAPLGSIVMTSQSATFEDNPKTNRFYRITAGVR